MNSNNETELKPYIRPMTVSDIDSVMALEQKIFTDPWPVDTFEESLEDNYHKVIIAEVNRVMAGYASYFIDIGEARLTNMAVAPDFRRKSIAKILLTRILEIVIKTGCRSIFLDVRPGNNAAIQLYRGFGFVDAYIRTDYYNSPVEDALVMVKNLTDE